LDFEPAYTFAGVVKGVDGEPVPGAIIIAEDRSNQPWAVCYSLRDGSFAITGSENEKLAVVIQGIGDLDTGVHGETQILEPDLNNTITIKDG